MHPVAVGISLVALAFAGGWVALVGKVRSRVAAIRIAVLIVAWTGVTAVIAATGALRRWDLVPPPLVPVVVGSVALAVALGRSRAGGEVARAAPLVWLVGLQALRLPLELVMAHAARTGLMPVEMSLHGYNLDVVTGAAALVVALLAARGQAPRWLLWTWNVVGIATLLIVVAIAIATTPTFAAFGTAPAHLNTWITAAPYVWLPTVIVPCAVVGHVLLTRRLLAKS